MQEEFFNRIGVGSGRSFNDASMADSHLAPASLITIQCCFSDSTNRGAITRAGT